MESTEEIDDVKINIRAVMSTCRDDMTYASLLMDYEELVYKPMPLCGYGTCVELMNSIPDVIQVIPGKPNRLRLVPSAKSQHIVKLVKEQKSEESTTKQSVNKLKTRDIPSRVNNTMSSSQWPPVSELWQNGFNFKRSSTSADPCHTTAKNECKPKVNSKVVQSQSSQVRDDRRSVVASSREEINSSASQWPPLKGLWLNNTNWKYSSTSDHEHRTNGISECEPNLPSHVVHGQPSKLPINDHSSVKSTIDPQLYIKIKNLDQESIDQFFEDI